MSDLKRSHIALRDERNASIRAKIKSIAARAELIDQWPGEEGKPAKADVGVVAVSALVAISYCASLLDRPRPSGEVRMFEFLKQRTNAATSSGIKLPHSFEPTALRDMIGGTEPIAPILPETLPGHLRGPCAADLESARRPLSAILTDSKVDEIARRLQTWDQRANDARAAFDSASNTANRLILVAATTNAASIAVGLLWPDPGWWSNAALIVLGLASMICGAVAATQLFRVTGGKLLQGWLGARARAEAARLAYFERIVSADPPGPPLDPVDHAKLLSAKLSFFCVYELELQRHYFKERAVDHQREANRYLNFGAAAAFVQSLAAFGGGLVAISDRTGLALTAFAMLGPALASFAATHEAMRQNRVRAQRFRSIEESLSLATEQLSDVRRAAAAGDSAPVQLLVKAVHEPLAAEMQVFRASSDAIGGALTELNQSLEKLRTGKQAAASDAVASAQPSN